MQHPITPERSTTMTLALIGLGIVMAVGWLYCLFGMK